MIPIARTVRVLFDHQTFSYQRFGGNSRYFAELIGELSKTTDVEVDLPVARSPNEYLQHAPYYRGITTQRTDVRAFLATYVRNAVQTQLVARRPHDIYHATFYDPAALLAVRKAKLVVTVLDMIPEHFPEAFTTTGWYGRLVTKRWIEGKRTLCERADAILAISEHTKRDVVDFYGIEPERITVTHLGNRLSSDGRDPRPAGFPEYYVLYVGTRNTYKNWVFFVDAIAPVLADDPALHAICIGGGAFDATETALLERLGLTGRVHQRSVRDSELAPSYAHARAFVFPSLYEGFGIPILEAFACGCPTLLATASCFPEIAGDAARFFDPKDPASLRSALTDVLGNTAVAEELRRKGRDRARQFTWAATAQQTLAVYRRLCA